jgi:hypothetical protein
MNFNKLLLPILLFVMALGGCATIHTTSQKETNQSEISAVKNIELFYNEDAYGIIVVPSGGLLALASIGEGGRTEERSKIFTEAVSKSFPQKNLNFVFAENLAQQIRAIGIEVKVTEIRRPTGAEHIIKTQAYLDAPKTPGYNPLVLRITTQFIAPSFMNGFRPTVDVTYLLASADGTRELLHDWVESTATEKTFTSFNDLLVDHQGAYGQLREMLSKDVSLTYAKIFK